MKAIDKGQLMAQKALVRRRRLLHDHLTPEVLEAIEETLGVKGQIFSFTEADRYDPIAACRKDTLTGVVKLLRHEAAMAGTSECLLTKMEKTE